MELGAKLRQARLEMGLSQRQLCGDVITRNMLSQIENGSARPSMDTLVYLAGQLGKPIGYFLEETPFESPNARCMENARAAYQEGRFADAEQFLREYQSPDGMFDAEFGLLRYMILLCRAEQAQSRGNYAQQLLEQAAQQKSPYITEELERRRLLLLAQVSNEPVKLPVDDRALLHRAKMALAKGDSARCVALLEACEDRDSAKWHYLRAEAVFLQGDYRLAASHYPENAYGKLEECYRNLGDYKLAYEYACKQRENPSFSGNDNV